MPLILDEDQSYSLSAFVTSPGPQSVVARGFISQRRGDGVYMAPLIPRLFYGADGTPLGASWRQNLTATGDQVILSRSGGEPSVPREELFWRKVSDGEEPTEEMVEEQAIPDDIFTAWSALPLAAQILIPIAIVGSAIVIGYFVLPRP